MSLIVGLVALALAAMAYVRLAPSDPARWHLSLAADGTAGPDCTAALQQGRGDARAACLLPGAAADVLARIDAIALATPRTTRLAGSPAEGRITWITRSALWGFPDYTTAQATDVEGKTRLDVHARLRFGGSDLGVNAARLRDWLARLSQG